jgi:hypothetical protein
MSYLGNDRRYPCKRCGKPVRDSGYRFYCRRCGRSHYSSKSKTAATATNQAWDAATTP